MHVFFHVNFARLISSVSACMCVSVYINPPAPHGGINQVNPSHSGSDEEKELLHTHVRKSRQKLHEHNPSLT